jgi:DNA-binding transcriptional LysR family regulator
MDIRELTYFVAVYEERSLTAAARRCSISQPSVSAAISSLEHELDARLFLRHRKGVTPTAPAQRLYPMARSLIDDAAALKAALRAQVPAAKVTVGIMPSLDAARMRDVLAVVARETRRPEVELRVVGAGERCDLRVVSRSMVARDEVFVPLWSERYVAALPARHPLASRRVLRSKDLAGEPMIAPCHCEHARHFARGSRRAQVVAEAGSEEWATALVAAGVGFAVLPEGSAGDDPQVALRPLADVGLAREVGLAHRASGPVAADVQRLVDAVRRRFPSVGRSPGRRS